MLRTGAITLGGMDSRRVAFRRIAIYAAAVGLIFGVAAVTGSLPTPDEARDWGEGLGDFAYVAFVPLFVIANSSSPGRSSPAPPACCSARRQARRSRWPA